MGQIKGVYCDLAVHQATDGTYYRLQWVRAPVNGPGDVWIRQWAGSGAGFTIDKTVVDFQMSEGGGYNAVVQMIIAIWTGHSATHTCTTLPAPMQSLNPMMGAEFVETGGNGMNGNGVYEDDDPFVDDAAGGGAIVVASVLVSRIPWLLPMVRQAGQSLGAVVGSRFGWAALPGWFRGLLTPLLAGLGVTEILEFIFDMDIGLPGGGGFSGGGGDDPVGAMVEAMTVSTWDANGVQFHRLSDGRMAVRNKHGVWKVWRPKKPIVIFATGAQDLRTALRVSKVMDKQAKEMAKMMRRQGYKVSRS